MAAMKKLPAFIASENELEDFLSTPSEALIEDLSAVDGDIMILGAGGKMGPSMAKLAMRAVREGGLKKKVYAVNRSFREEHLRKQMEELGIQIVKCDFLEDGALEKLPECQNIIFLAGMKFGSSEAQAQLWALNCLMPGLVARRFRSSRIVELSSGNIYGLNNLLHGGPVDGDDLKPFGDYAMSVLGRDRMFEYAAETYKTPVCLLRLFYALDLRYGIIVDVAQKILSGTPIDVTMGNLTCIWQGDANSQTLRALKLCSAPAKPLIVTGPETVSIRWMAKRLSEELGKEAILTGIESTDIIMGNSAQATRLFGYPTVPLDQVIIWVAHWLKNGGPTLGKPTKFQVRDGKF